MASDTFLLLFLFFVLAGTPVLGFVLRSAATSTVRRVAVIVTYFYVLLELRPVLTWAPDPVFFPAIMRIVAAVAACACIWIATSQENPSGSRQEGNN